MSDCFVLYLLLICMKKKKSGAGKFTNNRKKYVVNEYSRAAEPPVRGGVSHLSRRNEPL